MSEVTRGGSANKISAKIHLKNMHTPLQGKLLQKQPQRSIAVPGSSL